MRRAACKDWAEASCLISNLLAELEQPCRICREDSLVLEAEGCDELLDAARKRGCPDG